METSIDAFLGGRFQLEQPLKGLRAGVDAMLLAATVPCTPNEDSLLLDAGCGAGPIALSIAARFPLMRVVAVERQSELAALARRNTETNGLNERIEVIEADLTQPLQRLQALGLEPESCRHVVANPPYYDEARSRPNQLPYKEGAHRIEPGSLEQWLRFLTAMCAPKGTISLIHRPESLPELLNGLAGRFGEVKIAPIYSRPGEPAIRVILQGKKGSRAPLQLLPIFGLREEAGGYSAAANAILRDGASWPL